MMIQQIFKAWGIDFPENDLAEIYLTEYLGEKFPSKSFLIDLFPKPIEVEFAYKFDQIEDEDYLEVCKRTYKVLKKLWVNDEVYFYSHLLWERPRFKKWFCADFWRARKIFRSSDCCVKNEKHLRLLMKLSRKNVIDLVLVLVNTRIVIEPSWFCFFLFSEKDANVSLVKSIVESEGLFLRDFS